MELRQLRAIVAAAEEASISEAAEKLHVSQSALSQQIGALERELGVHLFSRGRTGTIPTAAGEDAVTMARSVLAEIDEFIERIRLAELGPVLRIGCIIGSMSELVPQALRRLRGRFPEVAVRLSAGTSADVVTRLRLGQIDMGIVSTPFAAAGLHRAPLYEEELVFLVRTPEVGAPPAEAPFRQLASQPLILFPPGNSIRELVDSDLKRHGIKPTIALECDSAEVICHAVLEGLGAATVSRNFVRRYAQRGLSAVRIADGSLRRRVVLLQPHGSDSAVMRGFTRALCDFVVQPGVVDGRILVRHACSDGDRPIGG